MQRKCKLSWSIVVLAGVTCNPSPAQAKSWTCRATFSSGTHSYKPPPWVMHAASPRADRQARCAEYIQETWLETGSIKSLLRITAEEEAVACANAGGIPVRIDYHVDATKKAWQMLALVAAACPPPSR